MSIVWDYVSELRPQTFLLFIHQMIYEHGEPWWNDIDRRKPLIRPPELSHNLTSSHLIARRRNRRREWWIWPCEVFCSYLPSTFTLRKILRHGASGFTSVQKESALGIFIVFKNRVWTREPWGPPSYSIIVETHCSARTKIQTQYTVRYLTDTLYLRLDLPTLLIRVGRDTFFHAVSHYVIPSSVAQSPAESQAMYKVQQLWETAAHRRPGSGPILL
jgi:hypothetical protein